MTAAPDPRPRLAGRLRLARAALTWERLWPAVWPPLGITGLFAAVALLDLLPDMPGWLHVAALALFVLAFAVAAILALRGPRGFGAWPDRLAARRRLEVSTGLRHRPLEALADKPSVRLDGESAALWEAHQRRMAAAARRLRVGWPAAGLARRDPWGLRAVLLVLLILAAVDAGPDWRDRIVRAFLPNFSGTGVAVATSLDVWLTPPEYTGLPPQFLRAGAGDPVRVPIGSTLLAQVHGGGSAPRLTIDRDSRDFTAIDKQNFRAEATLRSGTELSVNQGGITLGKWPIEIVPDNPPEIAFAQPPKPTTRAALRLDYRTSDDYGVESVKAVIRRDDNAKSADPAATIELELPLPGLHLKQAEGTSYHDLTPHPWAGLPVTIRLAATDGLGQTGESAPVQMTLPERSFNHPVARAIIDQRRELTRDPASADAVAEVLGDLNQRPALFRDDTVVYLALRLSQDRLAAKPDAATIASVQQLMWDTALRIEDGRMSMAERDLRRLQQELQDALAKGAPDAEIERLMNELRQALDRYMQALAQEMQRNPEHAQNPVDPSRVISSRDLQRMIDRARELARSGARDQARELLSQLQNMLENLRMAQPGETRQRGSNEAQQMMRGMQELMQRQQQLLDRSFRAQRQQGQPERNGQQQRGQQQPGGEDQDGQGQMGEMGEAANQQEGLRHMLGEIMRRLGDGMGEIPEPFGRAERSMRDAAGALQRGHPGDAIGPQTEALDQLQQAAREFAKQMQKQMGNGLGEPSDDEVGATDRTPRDRSERDPFGRPLSSNGTYDQGDVQIPDQNTLQKSREILDELRRRAGERFRPSIELDYIERLLKRF